MSTSKMICTACGSTGWPKTITPGHFLIEVLLWLCFLLPGVLYSLWRMTARKKGCPVCGSTNMVPVDSPMGRKLVAATAEEQA